MGCLSKGVTEGSRWAPEAAPQKHAGRLRTLELLKKWFSPEEQLYVLSLPGSNPIMENLILEVFPDSFFDLIERDFEVMYQLLDTCLNNSYLNLVRRSVIQHMELRKFLFNPTNQKLPGKPYDVVILDLMGGWNREYCTFFQTLFDKPYVKPGSLIVFTYCPFNRFHQNIDASLLPFRFEDLLKRFPMNLIDTHDYNDSKTHLYAMKTVVFEVTEEGSNTVEIIDTKFDLYNSLYQAGWRPAHEIVNKSPRATTWFVKSLKDEGFDYKLVDHNTGTVPSRVTMFPPGVHAQIRSLHNHHNRGLATTAKNYTDRLQPSDLDQKAVEAPVEMTKVIPSMTELNKPMGAVEMLETQHPDLYKAIMLMKALKELNIL